MLNIRAFTPSDTQAVVELWQQEGLTRPWNDPYRDIERKLQVQPELFLVMTESEQVIGTAMAGYDGHRGSLYYFAIASAHQGRGLGRRLFHAVEEKLAVYACPKINLMVRNDNASAQAFYQKLGFSADSSDVLGLRLIPDEPNKV